MRRFIGIVLLLVLFGPIPATSFSQCVYRTISVSRVQGAVFDPSGEPIPNVEVSLKREGQVLASIKTDEVGRFTIPASPGTYDLDLNVRGFARGDSRIEVGSDLIGAFGPTNLWIILQVGRLMEDCGPFVTKSRRQFQKAVREYMHDVQKYNHQDSTKTNATQK